MAPARRVQVPGVERAGVRGPAHNRRLQLMERADALQRPPARPRCGGETRRVAGRRLPAGVSRDVPGRVLHAAHGHALPQPDEHGRRGVDSRQPAGRRGAARRLRQDYARPAHGGGERRRAGDTGHRRPATEGELARGRARERARTAGATSRSSGRAGSPRPTGPTCRTTSSAAPATAG